MLNINEWMLKTLRTDVDNINRMPLQWLEIVRNNWTPLVVRAISFIIDGGTFLLCTDNEREWLRYYILSKMNTANTQRPFIPLYEFDASLIKLLHSGDNQGLQDVLNLSYHRYALWYIGKTDTRIAQFALEIPESFLWVLDESLEHSFTLSSTDSHLDFKLIQAYRIFEQTLFAGICGEFHTDNY